MGQYIVTTKSGKFKVTTRDSSEQSSTPDTFQESVAGAVKDTGELFKRVGKLGVVNPVGLADLGVGIVEGATAGIPRVGLEKLFGRDLPRGSGLGQIGGFIAGPAKGVSFLGNLAKAGKFGSVLSKSRVARGAAEGALAGTLIPSEDPFDPELKKTGAIGGAILGGIFGVGGKVLDRAFAVSKPKLLKLLDRIDDGVNGGISKARKQYGDFLESASKDPKNVANFADEIDNFTNKALQNEKLLKFSNRVPRLKSLLDDPAQARSLNAKQVQDLTNEIKENIRVSAKKGTNVKELERDLFGFLDDLAVKAGDSFAGLAELKKSFTTKIRAFNLLRTSVGGNRTERSLINKFGGVRGEEAFRELVGDSAFKEISKLGSQLRFFRDVKGVVTRGVPGGIAGATGGTIAGFLAGRGGS